MTAIVVVVAATAPMFNLPEAGLLLIMGIDQFLDMGRTATNVVGNSIATAVIAGASEVRVGGVAFTVAEGDMYFLVGAARDDVDHEVYAGQQDRLSVTIRYGAQANSIQSERA